MDFLRQTEKLLDMAPKQKFEVLSELKSHIAFVSDELIESGMDKDEAPAEAESRMGTPEDIARRLNAEYNTPGWKSILYAVIPLFAIFAFNQCHMNKINAVIAITIVALITSFLCIRELIKNRRPVWLGPNMALALWCYAGLINLAVIIAKHNNHINSSMRISTFCIAGFLLLTLMASIITGKLRKQTLLLTVISIPFIFYLLKTGPTNQTPGSPFSLGILAILYLVAIQIFARTIFYFHKYSDALQASIFIFTFIACGLQIKTFAPIDITPILIGVMIIFILKSQSHKRKIKILEYAFIPYSICRFPIQPSFNIESIILALIMLLIWLCFSYLIIHWYILIPINAERNASSSLRQQFYLFYE